MLIENLSIRKYLSVFIVFFFLLILFYCNRSKKQTPQVKKSKKSYVNYEPSNLNDNIISWLDVADHYGEYKTVEGTIVATYNSGKACFLNFHPDYRHSFTAVIFASAFYRFPEHPEQYFYGKKVRVTGIIKEYRGKPEIIVNYPNQIEIIE